MITLIFWVVQQISTVNKITASAALDSYSWICCCARLWLVVFGVSNRWCYNPLEKCLRFNRLSVLILEVDGVFLSAVFLFLLLGDVAFLLSGPTHRSLDDHLAELWIRAQLTSTVLPRTPILSWSHKTPKFLRQWANLKADAVIVNLPRLQDSLLNDHRLIIYIKRSKLSINQSRFWILTPLVVLTDRIVVSIEKWGLMVYRHLRWIKHHIGCWIRWQSRIHGISSHANSTPVRTRCGILWVSVRLQSWLGGSKILLIMVQTWGVNVMSILMMRIERSAVVLMSHLHSYISTWRGDN